MEGDGGSRARRRCSVASNSGGYYTEYDDKLKEPQERKTPAKDVAQLPEAINTPRSRRSTRHKTPTKKYSEDYETPCQIAKEITPSKTSGNSFFVVSDEENDEFLINSETRAAKARNLFDDSVDVDGKQIYGFRTPKKRDGMVIKAMNTPKSPKTQTEKISLAHQSPTSSKKIREAAVPKTPRHVRSKIKAGITKLMESSSDLDFSADESEYDPEESTQSSSTEESDDNTENSGGENESNTKKAQTPKKPAPMTTPCPPSTSRRSQRSKTEEYIPESDNYFTSHASKKILTSDHTLNRLKNPRLGHAELFSLLESMKPSTEHERCIERLLDKYKSYFDKWMFILSENFTILLYGLGSKRKLIHTFHEEKLKHEHVIVVNGFFPSLTLKEILDGITREILELNITSSNMHEIVDIIKAELTNIPEMHIYLLVHNIDGPMLRNSKAQEILSRLAAIHNIHLVASIDHIKAPLLWDQLKLRNYNFSWWDVTTMLPYTVETSFENSLLVQNTGELALSSMNNVFQSLTANARKIYLLIVERQLKSKNDSNYQGIVFKDLYWLCRESFLVSSDLALRAQLTEFIDHKLIKSKRTADGAEHLRVPIASALLEQFMEEQNK